jgi:3-oxoacyl-[acyl-carrier-protein] synthase-3
MLLDDIYIQSLGVHLGERVDLAEAVADGRYPAADFDASGLLAVSVSDKHPPDQAVAALRQALDRESIPPEDFRLLLHAIAYFQGEDMWTPSNYIQLNTIGGSAPAIDVDQKSNGGLATLALAAGYLSQYDDASVAITSGERFCLPGFDRFRADPSTVFGDGGTAMVLGRRPGFARILSCVMTSDSTLEDMFRDGALKDAPRSGQTPLSLRKRTQAYMRRHITDLDELSQRIMQKHVDCLQQALDETKTDLSEVSGTVLNVVGQTVAWGRHLGLEQERTNWEFGRRTGHMGPGDQTAGLDDLLTSGRLSPGDRVVLTSTGYGFNWGTAVLEILHIPDWAKEKEVTAP